NAYTQFDFRGPKMRVDYDAVRNCMEWVAKTYEGSRIGLPKIGAGLAGGDWSTLRAIVEETFDQCEVTIVNFQP
ncbi:MAG: phosphatase, partial [Verrucomicrobium sp.]